MAAYKLTGTDYVIRESDGAFVPIRSPKNRDTQEYHRWIGSGGNPDPPDIQPVKRPAVSRARLRNLIDAVESSADFDAFKAAVAGFTE